ncbi:MAG TPA: ABC transporter ATP-binding protein [Thermomicrobiales bacterium]|nr:ABC transporter ATP-binding protein [Thermomicrobiales bacterium]
MADIHLESVTKIFDKKVRAVDRVDLTISDQEFIVLLGPSGCGKTTLMRMIAGLEYPDGGRVLIGGRDVTDLPPRKRPIAMVFQSYAVFPHLTVAENIGFGLRVRHTAKSEIQRRVKDVAELVQIGPYLDRYPVQLSGGQRQRVAVARAVVMEPEVLLMDEPLSNLDALLRLTFRAELKRLVAELKTTTIYVTHDQVEALSLGDRIAVMQEGRIIQVDAPMAVYDRPVNQFVGSFIGNPPMNFLHGRLQSEGGGSRVLVGDYHLAAPDAVRRQHGDEVLVGIRAENVVASETIVPDAIEAQTEVVEPLGSQLLVTALVGDQRIKLLTHPDFPARANCPIWIRPEPDKLRWFDIESHQEIATA